MLGRTGTLIFSLFLTSPSHAQGAGPDTVMSKPETVGAGTVEVVHGDKQTVTDWPATFKFLAKGNFICTSTIVGEKAVVTAAHCLENNARIDLEGMQFNLLCSSHPRFDSSTLAYDIALCAADKTFPNDFPYENLDLRITHVRQNGQIFLLGYGCRQFPQAGGDPAPLSGQLYGGLSTVQSLPQQPGGQIVTQGGVVICPGDSGGSAYVIEDAKKVTSPRSVVGINSEYSSKHEQSYVAQLAGDLSPFIRDWADDNKLSICGIHLDAKNCRPSFAP